MPRQGSKSGKSSKTARVLNLLTDPESVEKPAEKSDAAENSAVDNAKLADDRRTQAKIRGALEEELANMPAPSRPKRSHPAKPKAEPEEEQESAPVPEDKPAAEERPVPEPKAEPEPIFTVPAQPPTPMQTAVSELRSADDKDPEEYICYNVTQTLVEDKADKYIRMFNLCSCNRCRIDVIALALSNLPPKYVVAKPRELIPRLSVYEQKYNAAVVTQVMSACKKVLDRPHHDREQ